MAVCIFSLHNEPKAVQRGLPQHIAYKYKIIINEKLKNRFIRTVEADMKIGIHKTSVNIHFNTNSQPSNKLKMKSTAAKKKIKLNVHIVLES